MSDKKQKIYIADRPINLMDGSTGKSIARFGPYTVFDEHSQITRVKGYLVTSDEKVIKEIESLPGFGRDYKETQRIPLSISNPNSASIIAGVATQAARDKAIDIETIREQEAAKMKEELDVRIRKSDRYFELKYSICKKDGTFMPNIADEIKKEYLALKQTFEPNGV
jgi:gamma-glutamylcyclotransferase (GGCT)/AIG2-like uncharacterized protein YtfP